MLTMLFLKDPARFINNFLKIYTLNSKNTGSKGLTFLNLQLSHDKFLFYFQIRLVILNSLR